ncbi:MAG: hypothetical protein Q4B01_03970 [Eubacteriales bacterium]|nr:hypothetical protein [Eubacteriales bacterium]
MTKRKRTYLRGGEIIDVEEYHDHEYGAPGKGRSKKEKPTPEQMRRKNAWNKARKCRQFLLEYFKPGDCLMTFTYKKEERPEDMTAAKKDFKAFMEKIRKVYTKRGKMLFWIRNIECGTRGGWHIHLVINEIGDTASIVQKAWKKGGVWSAEIRSSQYSDIDMKRLANYLTKDEHTREPKKDGNQGKPKIRESSYSRSRNMILPEPKVDKLTHWKKETKPKKGYYIASIYEGINPVTGYHYRRYTMISLSAKKKSEEELERIRKRRKKKKIRQNSRNRKKTNTRKTGTFAKAK